MTYDEDSWNTATRGDEMLRYAMDCGVSVKQTAWAAANCARVLVGTAPESERAAMLEALDVVYRWCHGEASDAELIETDDDMNAAVTTGAGQARHIWSLVHCATPVWQGEISDDGARYAVALANASRGYFGDAGPLVREAIPWQAICDAQARAA